MLRQLFLFPLCALSVAVAAGVTAQRPPVTDAGASYIATIESRWPASGDVPISPARVNALIARNGARRTVRLLWGNGNEPSRWHTVGRGIARGGDAWLAVAARLSPGTDAGSSDDFAAAVQDAVVTNAAGALRLLTRIPMGAGACADNGFETPPAQASAYYAAAIHAVEAVHDPALASIKTQCLASLHEGQAALASSPAQ
jgi:hypothetical protein